MSGALDVAVADGVATITFDHPEAANALTFPMRDELRARIRDFDADPAVRAIVLTGAGDRWFCTGAALGGAGGAGATGRPAPLGDVRRTMLGGWQTVIAAVLDAAVPVVAAMNGTAAGGGAALVLASDLVIAGDDARLVEVFVHRGLVPDAGSTYLLPRLVGLTRAKQLLLTGDAVTGTEMARLGLANRAVPRREVSATARGWAERLAVLDPERLAAVKRASAP